MLGFWMKPKRDEAPDLTNEERDIVGIFRTFSNGENEASPKQDFLAYELGCTVRSIQRYLDGLIEKGWITKTRRGLKLPNRYSFSHSGKEPTELQDPDATNSQIHTRQIVASGDDKLSDLDTTPVSPLDTTPVSPPYITRAIQDNCILVKTAATSAEIPGKGKRAGPKQPVQEVFDLFKEITGWLPLWKNTTERDAAETLYRKCSMDELRTMLIFARRPENKDDKFFPQIASPYDLVKKWVKFTDKLPKTQISKPEQQPWDAPIGKHDPNASLRGIEQSARDILAAGGSRDNPLVQMALKRGIKLEDLTLQKT